MAPKLPRAVGSVAEEYLGAFSFIDYQFGPATSRHGLSNIQNCISLTPAWQQLYSAFPRMPWQLLPLRHEVSS